MARATAISYAPLAKDLGISEAEAEVAVEKGMDVPKLGMIHPAHLPLWLLKERFPASWRILRDAQSFALVRAVRPRFLSAVMQRLREFRDTGPIRSDDPVVREEAARVCEWLATQARPVALEYVHFIPQSHFIDMDGRRIVNAIFPTDRMDAVADWLDEAGLHIEITHDHARRQPKPWARPIQPIARFAGRYLMPHAIKRALHPIWARSGAFADAAGGYAQVDLGSDVEDFIASYYASDQKMFEESLAGIDRKSASE
ncbi:hypothetical protein [Jannaschia aquimarina]|nr:hypothetical protein [Jannaschia aquimarina]